MNSKRKIIRMAAAFLCMVSMLFLLEYQNVEVSASSGYGFVILSKYEKTMKVGDTYFLTAVTSNYKKPTFSSSNSKVASVNTYGKITAKKAGSAIITAKIKNGEASCKITVEKTKITLNEKNLTLENGETALLKASVSTGHPVTWKSEKKSIAAVSESGEVTAKKPGTTTITAKADGVSVSCKVTVKKPTVRLMPSKLSLYRREKFQLNVSSTSHSLPVWKSNKKSVATVDESGKVTAVKHGTAVITVTVDGVSKTCEVTVKSPKITFEQTTLTLTVGERARVNAQVSSGNTPTYSCSNSNVVSVDANGVITAKAAGRSYVYASEDGTKERITVYVKEKNE